MHMVKINVQHDDYRFVNINGNIQMWFVKNIKLEVYF